MTRVKHGVAARKRHKKLFRSTKGYRGKHRYSLKQASNAHAKAGVHAYRHRKLRKREFHQLWILRINAACRELGIKYSRFIYGMDLAGIKIDRRMLSELAVNNPEVFKQIVEKAKAILPEPGKSPDLEALKKHYEAAHKVVAKAPKADKVAMPSTVARKASAAKKKSAKAE
jgi:large subunit ribosomal protein L20